MSTFDDNPYAAPLQGPTLGVDVLGDDHNVWRSGRYVIAEQRARFPSRCIKCNTADNVAMKSRVLLYFPFWILILFVVCPVVVPVAAVLLHGRGSLVFGICGTCQRRRRRVILCSWLISLGGWFVLMSCIIVADAIGHPMNDFAAMVAASLAWMLVLVGIVYYVIRGRLVTVRRMDGLRIRLSGVCEAFVAELPIAPYHMARER